MTTRDLYAALYQLDQRLADRDTAFMSQLSVISGGLENHRSDRSVHAYADVIKEEIKLDAKKVGVVGAALAVLAAALTLLRGKLGV